MNASPQRFELAAITPQPWKNGAGLTREIACGGASAAGFGWRVSVAEVARDAPFSAFAGIDRCIVLLRGAGMHLRSADGAIDHALTTRWRPFRFPGEAAPDARLVNGPSSDFNVMTRRGAWRSEVNIVRGAAPLRLGEMTLVLCLEGRWEVDGITLGTMHGVLLPLPLGEGGGEGRGRSNPTPTATTRFAHPHPNPLPGGAGEDSALLVVSLDRELSL